MSAKIFINYRRDDGAATARSVHERLTREFGENSVFMDVDSLFAGQRFDAELDAALDHCDVLIALIGPRWVDILTERAKESKADYVQQEIARALERSITVIPVCFDGAELPASKDIPESIRPLVKYQRLLLMHERFGADMRDLIAAINRVTKGRRRPFARYGASSSVMLGLVAVMASGAYLGMHPGPIMDRVSPPASKRAQPISANDVTRLRFVAAQMRQVGTQSFAMSQSYLRVIAPLVAAAPVTVEEAPPENIARAGFDVASVLKTSTTQTIGRLKVYEALRRTAATQKLGAQAGDMLMSAYVGEVDFTRQTAPQDVADFLFEIGDAAKAQIMPLPIYLAFGSTSTTTGYYRFTRDNGYVGYYDSKGRLPRRFINRQPVSGPNVRLSSQFGMRINPILMTAKLHTGIDWSAPEGTKVVASANGTVEIKENQDDYGNLVVLRHRYDVKTAYAHLRGFAPGLEEGQAVKEGDVIGYVGNTGTSSGAHLHFEVRINDTFNDALTFSVALDSELSAAERTAFDKERLRIDQVLAGTITDGSIER